MEGYSLTAKTSKIEIPYSTCTFYTIPGNKNRKWIKIMLNYIYNKNIGTFLFLRYGKKWTINEVFNFVLTFEGEGIFIEINKQNPPFVIFEDKETDGKNCYKGSINLCFYSYNTGYNYVCMGYFED